MGNGSRQYAWLEKDLQNVDRVKTPWVILAGHRPMYTSAFAKRNSILLLCNYFTYFTIQCVQNLNYV